MGSPVYIPAQPGSYLAELSYNPDHRPDQFSVLQTEHTVIAWRMLEEDLEETTAPVCYFAAAYYYIVPERNATWTASWNCVTYCNKEAAIKAYLKRIQKEWDKSSVYLRLA